MGLLRLFHSKLLLASLLAALATVAVACGSDRPASEPTSTPPSVATPTPTAGAPSTPPPGPPTPTPSPIVPTATPTQTEVQVALDSARARWNSNRPDSYQFDLTWLCFCPQSGQATRISVEGRQVVSITDPVTGLPRVDGEFGPHLTLDELFDRVQTVLDTEGAMVLSVQFEHDLAYPISASFDQIVGAIDDELSFRATNFRVGSQSIDLEQLRLDLDAAHFHWFDSGPQSYEFVFRWECFCPSEANRQVRITVEGGQITSTVDAVTGAPVDAVPGLEYQTVTELFNWISTRLNRDPEFAELRFDAETGFPLIARFNPILNLFDEEEAFFIDELTVVDVHSELQDELDAARARWESFNPENYSFQFNWQCFCIQEFVARVTVTVRNGAVTEVIRVEDGQPVSEQFSDDFVTVDALFDRIQEAIDQGAASIRAQFDPASGLPEEVFIDRNFMIADEEIGWNAGDLTTSE